MLSPDQQSLEPVLKGKAREQKHRLELQAEPVGNATRASWRHPYPNRTEVSSNMIDEQDK